MLIKLWTSKQLMFFFYCNPFNCAFGSTQRHGSYWVCKGCCENLWSNVLSLFAPMSWKDQIRIPLQHENFTIELKVFFYFYFSGPQPCCKKENTILKPTAAIVKTAFSYINCPFLCSHFLLFLSSPPPRLSIFLFFLFSFLKPHYLFFRILSCWKSVEHVFRGSQLRCFLR